MAPPTRPQNEAQWPAALVASALGLGLVLVGAGAQRPGAYALAACHLVVGALLALTPGRAPRARPSQLIAFAVVLTVGLANLVVPDPLLPVVPLGGFVAVSIGAGLRSRTYAAGWVLATSSVFVASTALRPHLGLIDADWGTMGTFLLYASPPALFAALSVRSQSIAGAFRRNLELREIMHRKMERTHRELEAARERADASNEAKSTFLANMSHELRTPLNAIIGYSEMLIEDAEDAGDDDAVGDLRRIHGAGTHLVALISDVLDISKIEAGKMDVEVHEFELAPLVEEVRTVCEPLAAKKGNRLSVVHDVGDEAWVRGDSTKLRQILLNLLSNACKFTEGGEVSLTVNPPSADVNADWLVFSVADDGIGISPDQLERLFRPFTQADGSTTRKFGGTGLGLALSQQFARLMGGDIEVESALGQGSTFTLKIPRVLADEASPESAPPSSDRAMGSILVVDDVADDRALCRRILENSGFSVREAEDGRDALAALAEEPAAAIVLDLDMPVMTGYDLLDELQGRDELRCIPVVVITGFAPAGEQAARLRREAVDVFRKGQWSPSDLVQAIERQVRRAEVRCVETAARLETRV